MSLSMLRHDADMVLRTWGNSRKPRWMLMLRMILLTPGFQLVLMIRLQRALGGVPVVGGGLRRLLWTWTTIRYGCDIDPNATFGPGLYVPHPVGIVIGGEARVGRDVVILQNVTLGRGNRDILVSPTIGDGVEIGCGACVLGAITIGAGAKIGANSVVLRDVPAGAIAVGAPARVIMPRTTAGVAAIGVGS